jgi:hypothetical protein
MALQSVKAGFVIPMPPIVVSGAPTLSGNTLNASNHKQAIICKATAAKAIRKIHFRLAAVTTGDTLDCRIETVDATNGNPTGTLWAANTNAAKAIVGGDANTWVNSGNLTADATLAVGDVFAIVIANGAVPGNFVIARYEDQSLPSGFPYGNVYTGSWTKQASLCLMVVEYSDGSFEPVFGVQDMGFINTIAPASNSATNEYGNIFSFPFPCRVKGVWVWIGASGDFAVKLYDSDGTTVLATTGTVDKDVRHSTSTGVQFIPFTSSASLSKNTSYRVVIVPTTTTAISVYDFDVGSAAMMDCFPAGQNMYRSVKTSGNWVETTTSRTYMGLIIDSFDNAAAGGSYVFAG